MAKFNTRSHQAQPAVVRATSSLGTASRTVPDTRTFEGAAGWAKDDRTNLFLRATSSFAGGESSFYEDGATRDQVIIDLVRKLAVEDFYWTAEFLNWLRGPGNIRTASLMLACEAVDARIKAGLHGPVDLEQYGPTNRRVIDAVLQRPDEPGEMLAYWTANHGRAIPKPIKRGIADAVRRMYKQRSLLKYDTASHAYRFGDVLNLVHAQAAVDQGDLFKYALDRRHNPDTAEIPASLHIVKANTSFRERARANPALLTQPDELYAAAFTWEDALSLAGQLGVEKRKVWEAMALTMGYMALIRNLRNFDETGVSDKVAVQVTAKLTAPGEVAKSRQLPFRFYSAYLNAPSLRWAHALETALDLCLPNIPELPGRTLVLIDTSASMGSPMSGKSSMRCVQGAALFGAALALKNAANVDLHHFASGVEKIQVPRGGSVLKLTEHVQSLIGRVGHGTEMAGAIQSTYAGHNRVLLFSDMQAFGGAWARPDIASSVPADVPVYAFNLASHTASPMPTGGAARFDLGGLTDSTFALIPRLEAGMAGTWPWQTEAGSP